MLRTLLKFRHNLAKLDHNSAIIPSSHKINYQYNYINLKCFQITKNNIILARHFSSDMIADWPKEIKDFLQRENITKPTLIQEKTLPIAMQNKDLVGVARTGSGKTLAFAIPAIIKILNERRDQEYSSVKRRLPTCLVLSPTRELSNQTHEVLSKFRNLGINSMCLVGGASRDHQLRELRYANHDIYIATPGRLIDLIDCQMVDLSNVKYLVLDEADRMLDMGFEPQIRNILKDIPDSRQTVMWSATWPKEIQALAQDFMKDYEYIAVDSEKLKANPNIKQIIKVCQYRDKLNALLDCLRQFNQEYERPRILIFSNTKRAVDGLLLQLMRHKHRAVGMHGDRSQNDRNRSLSLFKNRNCNIMIATDVAARGLDINDITHIINFDFPKTIEDYIHRIGRTARHEKTGTSISFVNEEDGSVLRKLIPVLKETNQEIPDDVVQLIQRVNPGKNSSFDNDFRKSHRRNDFYTNRDRSRVANRNFRSSQRNSYDRDEDEDFDDYEDDRMMNSKNRFARDR